MKKTFKVMVKQTVPPLPLLNNSLDYLLIKADSVSDAKKSAQTYLDKAHDNIIFAVTGAMETEITTYVADKGIFIHTPAGEEKPFGSNAPMKLDVVRWDSQMVLLLDRSQYGGDTLYGVAYENLQNLADTLDAHWKSDLRETCHVDCVGAPGENPSIKFECFVIPSDELSNPGSHWDFSSFEISRAEVPELLCAVLEHMDGISKVGPAAGLKHCWSDEFAQEIPNRIDMVLSDYGQMRTEGSVGIGR